MLLPIKRLINAPLVSLQMEAEIARTGEPIIDPRKLVIVGFYVESARSQAQKMIIHSSDIREISQIGLIIDNGDVIMPVDDLVRLQEILDFDFKLIGLKVIDENGKKYGKVSDYSVEPQSLYIQQLYTQQSMIRSLSTMSNVINRSQIVSINNERIIISAPSVKDEEIAPSFVNPFRSSQPGINHPE